VDTGCLNETAFPIDEMFPNNETFLDPLFPSWDVIDVSVGSNKLQVCKVLHTFVLEMVPRYDLV